MQWQQQWRNMTNCTNCGLSMINFLKKLYTHMDTYTHIWTHLYTYGHIHRAKLIFVTPFGETWYGNHKKMVDDSCDAEPQFQWNGISFLFWMEEHITWKHLQKVTIPPDTHSQQNAKHKTKQYSATNDGFCLRPSKSLGTSVFDNFCNEILLHLANKMLYNCTCKLVWSFW